MLNPFVFQSAGPILPGQYLLGAPTWNHPVGLIRGRIVATAGASLTPTVFKLEVDGELLSREIRIFPRVAGGTINLPVSLGLVIDANAELRVKCISGPDVADDALRAIGFNLEAEPGSTVTPPDSEMFVQWVNGSERLRIFEYDPTTHLFTESVSGISAGRATIDNATSFSASILSTPVAECDGDQLFRCNEIICTGGLATTESPRLEFFIGRSRVATLTAAGVLYVIDVSESATVTAGNNRFSLYGGGVIAATIGPTVDSSTNILAAIECHEPV